MKTLVFLDIDGVLNNRPWLMANTTGEWKNDRPFYENHFCPENIRWLKKLFEWRPMNVVISSTWRLERSLEELKILFTNNGFQDSLIIGKTPDMRNDRGGRGDEIVSWSASNPDRVINDYDSLLIIDDIVVDIDNIFEDTLIVETSMETGFIEGHYKEAIQKIEYQL